MLPVVTAETMTGAQQPLGHGHGLDIETRHVTQFVPGDRNPQLECGVTVRCGVSGEMKTSAHLVPGWWSGDGDVCCLLPDLDRFH